MKRLAIYLATTFLVSWGAWWMLVGLAGSPGAPRLFMTLYLLGGFGPAIAAALAVTGTSENGGANDYLDQLFRWRVSPLWWAAAFVIPLAFAASKEGVAIAAGAGAVVAAPLAPIARGVMLFPTMIVGGGLEELGWRGVAQPEAERRLPRLPAALMVGAVWALWHLPLFHLPGVSQYGRNFPLFAADVLANACLLAWLYARTRSILLCMIMHAASNTATAMGVLAIGSPLEAPAWIAAGLKLAGAALLLAFVSGPRPRT